MTDEQIVAAKFWNESSGHCDCCGRQSKTIWGDLSDTAGTKAIYFVQWTVGGPEHLPNVDLVLGPWGEGSEPTDRMLVSLAYQPRQGGGSLMIVNGEGRRADDRRVCGRALVREEVIGLPLASEVFLLVDALWLTEPRISEIRALDELAPPI
jgi:hypothetical protein